MHTSRTLTFAALITSQVSLPASRPTDCAKAYLINQLLKSYPHSLTCMSTSAFPYLVRASYILLLTSANLLITQARLPASHPLKRSHLHAVQRLPAPPKL